MEYIVLVMWFGILVFSLIRNHYIFSVRDRVRRTMVFNWNMKDWMLRSYLYERDGTYYQHFFRIHQWTDKQLFPSLTKYHEEKK